MDTQWADTLTVATAVVAVVISAFSLWYAHRSSKAARASAIAAKRSAVAAEDQVRISAIEFAASAPLLDAVYYGGRWTVSNDGGSTAYNVVIDCDPHGCSVKPDLRTIPRDTKVEAFPRVHMINHSISLTWTRTPDGGPHDPPTRRVIRAQPTI